MARPRSIPTAHAIGFLAARVLEQRGREPDDAVELAEAVDDHLAREAGLHARADARRIGIAVGIGAGTAVSVMLVVRALRRPRPRQQTVAWMPFVVPPEAA